MTPLRSILSSFFLFLWSLSFSNAFQLLQPQNMVRFGTPPPVVVTTVARTQEMDPNHMKSAMPNIEQDLEHQSNEMQRQSSSLEQKFLVTAVTKMDETVSESKRAPDKKPVRGTRFTPRVELTHMHESVAGTVRWERPFLDMILGTDQEDEEEFLYEDDERLLPATAAAVAEHVPAKEAVAKKQQQHENPVQQAFKPFLIQPKVQLTHIHESVAGAVRSLWPSPNMRLALG